MVSTSKPVIRTKFRCPGSCGTPQSAAAEVYAIWRRSLYLIIKRFMKIRMMTIVVMMIKTKEQS
jgi:hypothetical protein